MALLRDSWTGKPYTNMHMSSYETFRRLIPTEEDQLALASSIATNDWPAKYSGVDWSSLYMAETHLIELLKYPWFIFSTDIHQASGSFSRWLMDSGWKQLDCGLYVVEKAVSPYMGSIATDARQMFVIDPPQHDVHLVECYDYARFRHDRQLNFEDNKQYIPKMTKWRCKNCNFDYESPLTPDNDEFACPLSPGKCELFNHIVGAII